MPALMNRLRRRLIGTDPDGPALVLWALGLAAVQTVGAQVRHDWFDAVALLVLSVLAGATWAWHRQNPISFVLWIERSARAWLHRWVRYRPSLGIDFRGDPPVRRGVPRVFLVAPALAALLVAACFAGGMGWLGELRFWARDGAYVFYLPVVAAVWTLSLLMAFRGVSSVVLQIREGFLRRRQEGRLLSRDLELRVYLFLGLDLVLGMLFLPLWVAEGLLALAGLSCVVLWALPRAAPLRVMWRNEAGEMRSFAMRTYYVLVGGALYAMSWALIWTLEGQGGGGSRDAMDLSRWLARPCAWGCAAAYGAVALAQWEQWLWRRRYDPAREARPEVHVAGALTDGERHAVRTALARQGLVAHFGGLPERWQVPVRVAWNADRSAEDEWPLALSIDDLTSGQKRMWILRRHQVQNRRILLAGLQSLFKRAASQEFLGGEGFWVGVQHSLVRGLVRDKEEGEQVETPLQELLPEDSIIGPPYHKLFHQSVRHYFWRVTRDLQVDLIYVADGVRWSALRRVLQTLFEVHDVYGGEQRIEEMHFAGTAGVRVILQEVQNSGSFLPRSFREPDYAEIGRARILVLQPDRGGHKDRVQVGDPSDRVPVLR
ncbi:MAG: hypothetical protein R3F33_03880 [Planctomycetota bacterium]